MKILHVISSINKGGAENHLYNLASKQSKENNDVSIIYFKGDSYWASFLKKNNVRIYKYDLHSNFNLFQFLIIFFKIRTFIAKNKPHVVHAHLALPEIIVSIIKFFNKKNFKLIISKHLDSLIFEGSYGQDRFISGLFFEKFIFKQADKIIFISKNVKNYFSSRIKNYNYKTSIIYYGINKGYFKNKIKEKKDFNNLRENKKQFIILNIARHIPQKKVDKLIEGYKEFNKNNENSKLILVGSGPDTTKLKKLAKKLNIMKKIIWINKTDSIKELFELSNLFCLTSHYEGLGLVLLESMLMQKPVVTINRSAMREIIKNNYNGILLKNNFRPYDLSNAFKKIQTNKKFKNKIKKNGLLTMNKKFNFDQMYSTIMKVYK